MSERFPDEVLRRALQAAGLHGRQGGAFEATALAAVRAVLDDHLGRACTDNPLQNQLLDLITLMPDTQTQELIDYVFSLRATRGWRSIGTAPTDGTLIRVLCPGYEGLPPIECDCAYHPDGGFCVDELRTPEWWKPK